MSVWLLIIAFSTITRTKNTLTGETFITFYQPSARSLPRNNRAESPFTNQARRTKFVRKDRGPIFLGKERARGLYKKFMHEFGTHLMKIKQQIITWFLPIILLITIYILILAFRICFCSLLKFLYFSSRYGQPVHYGKAMDRSKFCSPNFKLHYAGNDACWIIRYLYQRKRISCAHFVSKFVDEQFAATDHEKNLDELKVSFSNTCSESEANPKIVSYVIGNLTKVLCERSCSVERSWSNVKPIIKRYLPK